MGSTLESLGLLLLLDLEKQRAVDVWQHTTKGDGGSDQGIQLLVTTDGELQMAGCDALDLEVLGGVLWKIPVSTRQNMGESRQREGFDLRLPAPALQP